MSIGFIFRLFFQYFLSGLLIFSARSKEAIEGMREANLLPEGINNEMTQLILLSVGIFISILIVPVQLEIEKKRNKKLKSNLSSILQNHKKLFIEKLKKDLKKNTLRLHVRVFKPQKGLKFWFRKIWKKEIFFEIKNYDGFSEVGLTENLKFQVFPEEDSQGLVGRTYNSKNVTYDFNLKENQAKYNLENYQIKCTSECEFGIAAPIFDKKNNVIAIITFDSEEKITIPAKVKNTEWQESIRLYCYFLDPYISLLTKK